MDRRSFLKLFAAVGAALVLPVKWAGDQVAKLPDYRFFNQKTIRVAAFDASPESKAAADVVCTGHNDGTTIQNAIDRLGGGSILMDGGTFYMDRGITPGRNSVIVNCHFIGTRPVSEWSEPMFRIPTL